MKNKKHLTAILSLIMTMIALLGIFTACGGLPASTNQEETPKWDYSEPPELSIPEIDIETLPVPDIYIPPNISDNAQTEEDKPTVVYAASSESDKYHRTSCHYVDQILPQNLIYFYSESSAYHAGYSPCSICKP